MAGFSVNIGADIAPLTAGLNQATAEVQKFGSQLTAVPAQALTTLNTVVKSTVAQFDELAASAAALDRINASIDAAANAAISAGPKFDSLGGRLPLQDFNVFKRSIDQFKKDIASGFKFNFPPNPIPPAVPDLLNKTKVGANQAANALTNVGRIAQDLPFGFIGIQNNLNPLLESFQRLRAETGSNKAALSALGGSLIGPGGIGLALSIVSSAILIFSNNTRGAKKELEGFDKAVADSNKKAGDEIARVQVLGAVITDTTRAQSERSKASKELSGILKDLNINMSQEAILNGQVSEATKKATEAIIERARARAIEARIGDLSGQQLQRDLQRTAAADKLAKAQKNLADQEKIRQSTIGGGTAPGIGGNTVTASLAVNTLKKEIASLDKATAEANKEIGFLIGQIKSNDLTVDLSKGTEKDIDLLKQRIAALKELQSLTGLDAKQRVELAQLEIQLAKRDAAKLGFTKAELQQQIQGILEKAFPVGTFEFDTIVTTRVNKLEPSKVKNAKALTDGFKTDIAKAVGIGDTIEIPAPKLAFTNLDTAATKALDQARETINGVLKDMQVEIVAGFAEALGTALVGGDVGNIFNNIFRLIADGLTKLGKALITYGITLKGFKIALDTLNPGVALVAGLGAIAAGAALKAAVPKFASGGIVSGPLIGQIGEMHRPEVVMPLDRLPQMLRSIGGGGGNDLQLIPIINNEGLFLAMKRGERRAGRKF